MARRRLPGVLEFLRRLASGPGNPASSDRHLLAHFAQQGDEGAFAALVQRHGALVWGVCRRVLDSEQDAEDAFQATFLVLARRAGGIGWREDVGRWLYGVASRIARKVRGRNLRRRARTTPLRERDLAVADEADDREVRLILDEEIGRLPEKYRAPIVLCCLQGKTYGEAAELLGWPLGTVAGRLARGRDLLRGQLLRRGLAPSPALLAVLLSLREEAAASAALSEAVVRAAPTFALGRGIGDGLVSGTAIALANEGIGSMMLSKGRYLVLLLLLAAAGTSAALLAPLSPPEKQPEAAPSPAKPPAASSTEPGQRSPLPREWVGRWRSDPFAGTIRIDVDYFSEEPRTYRLTDPHQVAALMKKLTIIGFHDGLASDFPMIASLSFFKNDHTEASVVVGEGPHLSGLGGEIYIDPAFLVALGRQCPDKTGQPLDLLKRPPSHRQKPQPPLTLERLPAGFDFFQVTYHCGSRFHQARIRDRAALDELARALVVTKREAEKAPNFEDWPPQRLDFQCKGEEEGHAYSGCILDREHLALDDLGRVKVKPSFVKTLNARLSRLEGRAVDVLGKNPPPKEQLRREQGIRDKLRTARRLRLHHPDGKEVLIERREDLDPILEALEWVETPTLVGKLESTGEWVEVTTADAEKIRLAYLQTGSINNEKVDVNTGGTLVAGDEFGPTWLDSRFTDAVQMYAERWESKDDERRRDETHRLVCQNLPAFLDQVYNLVVRFRQGKDQLVVTLSAKESRPIVKILRHARFEKLSWTDKQWDEETLKLYKRGAESLNLMPGLGFNLFVVFRAEKELLVPGFGRILLREPILGKLRKALESDPNKASQIESLPATATGQGQ